MKNTANIILILIFTAVGIAAQKKSAVSDTSKDEAAIRANVGQMVKGWNLKSGAEFAKPFAEDADYVVINGFHIKGRAAIAEAHQRIFETVRKNSTLFCTVEQIRFLRPDVAVIHARGTLKEAQNDSTRTIDAKMTLVMTKENGKWEIAAFQNTAIQLFAAQGEK